MDQKQIKEAIGKPHMLRLKQIGAGIRVGKMMGARILVKTVTPRTELDSVEEKGLISIPKWVKQENTPLPTTGIVILTGPDIPCENCSEIKKHHFIDEGMFHCPRGENYTPTVQEGDMVMFPKFSGSDINIEDEDLRILESAEVMCTLVDTAESLVEVLKES